MGGLATDHALGPILFGVHRFWGRLPNRRCETCNWDGASVAFGTSEADIDLNPVRIAVLNALFLHRRGQSAAEIAWTVNESSFLRSIVKNRVFKKTSVKMEVSRLRNDIGSALERIGAPGQHFLPPVPHGVERYRLGGNWQVLHVPTDVIKPQNSRLAAVPKKGV